MRGGLEELLDNALNAVLGEAAKRAMDVKGGICKTWRPTIWVEFFDGPDPMLIVQDNGVRIRAQGFYPKVHPAYTYMLIPGVIKSKPRP